MLSSPAPPSHIVHAQLCGQAGCNSTPQHPNCTSKGRPCRPATPQTMCARLADRCTRVHPSQIYTASPLIRDARPMRTRETAECRGEACGLRPPPMPPRWPPPMPPMPPRPAPEAVPARGDGPVGAMPPRGLGAAGGAADMPPGAAAPAPPADLSCFFILRMSCFKLSALRNAALRSEVKSSTTAFVSASDFSSSAARAAIASSCQTRPNTAGTVQSMWAH